MVDQLGLSLIERVGQQVARFSCDHNRFSVLPQPNIAGALKVLILRDLVHWQLMIVVDVLLVFLLIEHKLHFADLIEGSFQLSLNVLLVFAFLPGFFGEVEAGEQLVAFKQDDVEVGEHS